MFDATATPTWSLPAPAADAGSTARIHLATPGRTASRAATMVRTPRPDGSQVIELAVSGRQVPLVIAAGESFADAWGRIEAEINRATYPSHDPNFTG